MIDPQLPKGVYRIPVYTVSAVALISLISIIAMYFTDKPAPEALIALTSLCIGRLMGVYENG